MNIEFFYFNHVKTEKKILKINGQKNGKVVEAMKCIKQRNLVRNHKNPSFHIRKGVRGLSENIP